MITLLYFARLKEITNKDKEEIDLVDTRLTVHDLLKKIEYLYQGISNEHFHIAVNEEYVPLDHTIRSGDIVALIPPVSGG